MQQINQKSQDKSTAISDVLRLIRKRFASFFSGFSKATKKDHLNPKRKRDLTPPSYTNPSPWTSDYHKNHWIRWG